jgi:hypothetical protein
VTVVAEQNDRGLVWTTPRRTTPSGGTVSVR